MSVPSCSSICLDLVGLTDGTFVADITLAGRIRRDSTLDSDPEKASSTILRRSGWPGGGDDQPQKESSIALTCLRARPTLSNAFDVCRVSTFSPPRPPPGGSSIVKRTSRGASSRRPALTGHSPSANSISQHPSPVSTFIEMVPVGGTVTSRTADACAGRPRNLLEGAGGGVSEMTDPVLPPGRWSRPSSPA